MRTMRRMLSAVLVLGLVAGAMGSLPVAAADASPAAAADASSRPGFATPEDAVRAYLKGIADGDVAEVLASAAIDEMATGLDFPAYIDRIRAWMPFIAPAPATHPFFVDLDRAQLTSQLLGQARMLVYSLLTTENLEGSTVVPVDAAWAKGLIDQLDPSRLAGMQVGLIVSPDPAMATDERYLANAATQAAMYGAQELTERVALIAIEGKAYQVGFTLMRFADGWKVSSQSSPLSNISVSGVAQPYQP